MPRTPPSDRPKNDSLNNSERTTEETPTARSAGKARSGKRRRRVKLFDRPRKEKLGLPPGTPVHLGTPKDFTPVTSLLQYHQPDFTEKAHLSAERALQSIRSDRVNWINIEGIHEVRLIQTLTNALEIHPLTQEDIVNASLRPQFVSYPGYFFFSLKMLYLNGDRALLQEHISIILKNNVVLSFQETPGDVFARIRERIKSGSGTIRSRAADYLVYLLIDSIVDGYYQVVDNLAEKIDTLEEELRCGISDAHLARVYEIRREILFLRKNIMPVRDLLSKAQVEGTVFQDNTRIYLKDLSEHIVQVTESLNLAMDMASVLLETYHSMQNQRMNAVMKTLTMISTVFLPLNFIAGIYGMNFDFMPELSSPFGYPGVLITMFLVAVLMVLFFIRKGWIFEDHRKKDFFSIFD